MKKYFKNLVISGSRCHFERSEKSRNLVLKTTRFLLTSFVEMTNKRKIATAFGLAMTVLLPSLAFAAGTINQPEGTVGGKTVKIGFSNLGDGVTTLLRTTIGVVGGILIIMLVIAGIQYMTGAGNDEQVTKAKKAILNAVIGLIITITAFAIGTFLISKFS